MTLLVNSSIGFCLFMGQANIYVSIYTDFFSSELSAIIAVIP